MRGFSRATVPIRVIIDDESKILSTTFIRLDLKSAVIDDIEEKVVPVTEKNKGKFG